MTTPSSPFQLPETTEAWTPGQRTNELREIRHSMNLPIAKIAIATGYSHVSVKQWLADESSTSHRPITSRALDRLRMEIAFGRVVRQHKSIS